MLFTIEETESLSSELAGFAERSLRRRQNRIDREILASAIFEKAARRQWARRAGAELVRVLVRYPAPVSHARAA